MKRTLSSVVLVASVIWAGCGSSHDLFPPPGDDAGVDASTPLGDGSPTFPDSGQAASFDVTPSQEQDIALAIGQTSPTVAYAATANNNPFAVNWSVDRPEVGKIGYGPSANATFTPTGMVGGLVNVTATHDKQLVQRQVLVKLSGSQNGSTNNETSQVATSVGQLTSGGGVGGVGGEGLGGAVDQATANALANPTGDGTAQGLKMLYPYDRTVFPRELLAPLLQWDWSIGDADAIRIDLVTTSSSFVWSGTFSRPPILQQSGGKFIRHPIPQDIWEIATNTAGTMIHNVRDQLTVKITLAKNGQGYGPLSQTWDVAPGSLKGTVYYHSYGTKIDNASSVWGWGAGSVSVQHGTATPKLETTASQCTGCHVVPANGSILVTDHDNYPGNGQDYDWVFDLKNPGTPTNLPQVNGLYDWPAISPDGKIMFSNSAPTWPGTNGMEGATNSPSGLYALPSGTAITTSAQISQQLGLSSALGGSAPSFSPDGKHIAFNFYQGGPGTDNKSADGKSLAVVDFDGVSKLSNLRTVYTPTCAGCSAVWSYFTPTSDALVFELEVVNNGSWGESTSMTQPSTCETETTLTGARGELWWVDLKTLTPHRLDVANGKGYLPTNAYKHDDDTTLAYGPTVAPVAAGGYVWIAFESRRLYGSVATTNPWCSYYPMTVPNTKKVWVAAIDTNAPPGTDPSHAAFYLPAQELLAGNAHAYWVLDPCKSDGNSCESGDECCGGHCTSSGDGGAQVCGNPSGCSGDGDVCSADGDCCNGHCYGGRCSVIIQ
jgi:hypothetical protein